MDNPETLKTLATQDNDKQNTNSQHRKLKTCATQTTPKTGGGDVNPCTCELQAGPAFCKTPVILLIKPRSVWQNYFLTNTNYFNMTAATNTNYLHKNTTGGTDEPNIA